MQLHELFSQVHNAWDTRVVLPKDTTMEHGRTWFISTKSASTGNTGKPAPHMSIV